MKAITLWQPWATLWAIQAKRNETRSWATTYTGPLAVHAAKFWNRENVELAMSQPFKAVLAEAGYPLFSTLPRGRIIAVCKGIKCYDAKTALRMVPEEFRFLETAFGDYGTGRFAWVPTDMQMLNASIEVRGAQGLWDVPTEIADKLILLT